MPVRPLKLPILLLALAVVIAIGVYLVQQEKNKNFTPTTGIVEAEEANLSAEIQAKITSLKVKVGDEVQKGQLVAKLDDSDLLAALSQAEASVKKAEADIRAAQASYDSIKADIPAAQADIDRALAGVEAAEANLKEAERQYKRAEGLYSEKLIPLAELDLKKTALDTARAALVEARAGQQAAEARLSALRAKVAMEQSLIASAIARKKEAEASAAYHRARLRKTEILSPLNGTVVFSHAEEGEIVSPGVAIVTVADLKNLWVRIDIEETLLAGLRLGDKVTIRLPSGETLSGEIAEIGRYGEFATQRDVVRGRQDIKTFRVRLRVFDEAGRLKPGMTVQAEIPKK